MMMPHAAERSAALPTDAQALREEKKRANAAKRRAEKEVAALEAQIAEKEARKKELEDSLADSNVYTNGAKCREIQKEIAAVQDDLIVLNDKWETAASAL